jgi:predicted nucleic acid-binding protein
MTTYVLDASFGAAHSLPDEQNEDIDAFFHSLTDGNELLVPQLFWYEISNIFRNNAVRKRVREEDVPGMMRRICGLGIVADTEGGAEYSLRLFELARKYNLTSYDASYLELAMRKGAALCTLDGNLKSAAIQAGIMVV